MKRRTIKLVFHVGRGRTGTTFLQSNLEKIPEVYFFGKYYGNERNNSFVGELSEVHNRLFRSFRSEAIYGFKNPSRNSKKHLDSYVNILCDEIRKEKRKKVFIISDECISDYSNYLGEWYTFLVSTIGNSVTEQLESEFLVDKTMSLTIRAQSDLLISSFGYSKTISKNFSKYIERELSNPEEGISGGLFYFSCYSLYSLVFDNSWKINIVPFEILSIDGDAETYIKKTFCLDEKFDFSNCDLSTRINVNSIFEGTNKKTLMKRYNIFIRAGFKFRIEHIQALKISLRNGFFFSFIFHGLFIALAIFLLNLGKILDLLFFIRKERFCYLDEDSHLKIIKTFQSDNKKLTDIIDLQDLKRFGYL